LLFKQDPVSHITETGCQSCLSPRQFTCSKCNLVYYCSWKCQKQDWKIHSRICKRLGLGLGLSKNGAEHCTSGSFADLRPELATLLLALAAIHYDGNEEIMDLESHSQDLSPLDHDRLSTIAKIAAQEYPEMAGDQKRSLEILAIGLSNNFIIHDPQLKTLDAFGMFTKGSLFNHSCIPNCIVSFSEKTLLVHSLVDIEAGKELLISYIDPITERSERQTLLKNRYHFICDCDLCQWEHRVTLITTPTEKLVKELEAIVLNMYEIVRNSTADANDIKSRLLSSSGSLRDVCFQSASTMKKHIDMADELAIQGNWKACIPILKFVVCYMAMRYPLFHFVVGKKAFLLCQVLWNDYQTDLAEKYLLMAELMVGLDEGDSLHEDIKDMKANIEIERRK
jgi:hypothetical protein